MLTIKDYFEEKSLFLKETKKQLEELKESQKALEKDLKVKEYLSRKQEIIDKELELKIRNYEFKKEFREKCNHPMYILLEVKEYGYGLILKEVHCIICGKEIESPSIELPQFLEELYAKKRLIASYRGIDERTMLPYIDSRDFTIKEDEVEREIENYGQAYLTHFLEIQKQIEKKELPQDYSIEDSFFDKLCESGYQRYQNDTKTKQLKLSNSSY